jgi:hypothetical protein
LHWGRRRLRRGLVHRGGGRRFRTEPKDQTDRDKIDVVFAADGIVDPVAFRLNAHAERLREIVLEPQAELVIRIALARVRIGN